MSGSYGCIPDNIATFERKADAIYHIIYTFELALYGRKADDLREVGYADLGGDYGADYAEIVRCTCDNVEIHNQD
jgi:hypothetical protein